MRIINNTSGEHINSLINTESTRSKNRGLNGLKKKLLYQGSLLFTQAKHALNPKKNHWSDRIVTPFPGVNIELGAVPLKNRNHHLKILKKLGLFRGDQSPCLAILTLLESFEFKSKGFFSSPVKPEDWKKLGVVQKIINAVDFRPLSQEEIQSAVKFLEEQHEKGIPTYVHCKAGRGRSATAVVCFLMKKFQLSAEEAKEMVVKSRPQVNLNEQQWQAIKTYEIFLNKSNQPG